MQQFTFGRNWTRFSTGLEQSRVDAAVQSVEALIDGLAHRPDRVLDLGCGSGLFSIAFARLGARAVIGIDIDPDCLQASQSNLERYGPSGARERVTFCQGSLLDADFMRRLPHADIVYAWGSLHHTGDLGRAVGLAADRVAPGGLFALAVYNRCATAFAWKIVKRVYNRVPAFMQGCAATALFLVRALARVVRGRHPLRDRRGMAVYVDAYDWLGGYPYEYATITEMEQMIAPLGFELLRVKPTRGSGCNEFVFRRRGD